MLNPKTTFLFALCVAVAMGIAPGTAGCSCSKSPTGPTSRPAFPLATDNTWTYAGKQSWKITGEDSIQVFRDTLTMTVGDKAKDGWYDVTFRYRDSAAGERTATSGFKQTDSGINVRGYAGLAGAIPLFKSTAADTAIPELFLPAAEHAREWSAGGRDFRFSPETTVTWQGEEKTCMALRSFRSDRLLATLFFDPVIGILAKRFPTDTIVEGSDTLFLTRELILDEYELR